MVCCCLYSCLIFLWVAVDLSMCISEQRYKDVHGISLEQNIEVGIEEWSHDISLKIFEIREKYGTPLSKMEMNEKNMLKQRAINAFHEKKKRKGEREEEEAQKPRKQAKRFCDDLGCRSKGVKVLS